jgi:four helix bundle protein
MHLCKETKHPLINQLLRSGTSIGANIHEANYAHSKADFIAKMQIALKECYETEYWLILFSQSKVLENKHLLESCLELKRMLIASCKTAKGNKGEIS